MIQPELENIKKNGKNMGGFCYFLHSLMTDYRNGQRGLRTVVEIGVRWGTSTNAFLYGIQARGRQDPKIQLYSIDINNCLKAVKDKSLFIYWTFIQGDSKEVVKTWDKGDIDILLIDGAHDYDNCKADYLNWEPFVKEGGLILFHDPLWFHKGVSKVFWDEVHYPKAILPLSKSGMGIVSKLNPPYYDESKIQWNHTGIAEGR